MTFGQSTQLDSLQGGMMSHRPSYLQKCVMLSSSLSVWGTLKKFLMVSNFYAFYPSKVFPDTTYVLCNFPFKWKRMSKTEIYIAVYIVIFCLYFSGMYFQLLPNMPVEVIEI